MKENYIFGQIENEIKNKKKLREQKNKIKPITADEYSEKEFKPMGYKEHWQTLRGLIQEKIFSTEENEEQKEQIKLLSEIITPELMGEYKQILKSFGEKTRKFEGHLERELIDINNEEFSEKIKNWIDNLIIEINTKNKIELNKNDLNELEAQSWLFFDSLANVMNAKTIERDITDFCKEKDFNELNKKDKENVKKELEKDLQERYEMNETETKILVNLIIEEFDKENNNYSPKILIETIKQIWDEYNLEDKKGEMVKISLGFLMSKAITSYTPSLFQDILGSSDNSNNQQFNLSVFFEYFGLNKSSQIIEAKTNIELQKVIYDLSTQINERISNSLFFQEFEFIHEKSLGEIYTTLENGKDSIKNLLEGTVSQLIPTLSGIAMSLGFLTKINPVLGAVSLAGLPVMYKVAKKQNETILPMYKKEMIEGEKIATNIGSIKSGFEEIKTLPEVSDVSEYMKKLMNDKDTLTLQRSTEEIKNRLKQMIPFDISTIVSVVVGGALQSAGMISGGAVLSNIIYSDQLNRPIRQLVNMYFNSFSRYVQNIKRMEEILGEYEKIDLPEGEKEKKRISVSELENYDISIEDLKYKNILDNINIDIKQGEFLIIAGPSGVGKSTLLRNLVGFYKPNGGNIKIGGVENNNIKKYGEESIYSIMSYCNQSPQIFQDMTLRENLLLWSKKEVEDDKIKQILNDLKLDKISDKLDEKIGYLSGGERVRVGVARILIKDAKIMLLDEPTASLDLESATEVRKIISEIHLKYPDTTIIAVTHDDKLIDIGDRSIILQKKEKK